MAKYRIRMARRVETEEMYEVEIPDEVCTDPHRDSAIWQWTDHELEVANMQNTSGLMECVPATWIKQEIPEDTQEVTIDYAIWEIFGEQGKVDE